MSAISTCKALLFEQLIFFFKTSASSKEFKCAKSCTEYKSEYKSEKSTANHTKILRPTVGGKTRSPCQARDC